jgi:HEAT repeat protein
MHSTRLRLLLVTLILFIGFPSFSQEPQFSPAARTLIEALSGSDPNARRAAAESYAQSKPTDIEEVLRVAEIALSDRQADVRLYAIVALLVAAWADEENAQKLERAVPDLIELLADEDANIRQAAANTIAAIMPRPPDRAASPLISLLEDPDANVVMAAMAALHRIGPQVPGVTTAVRGLLSASNSTVRGTAIKVLGSSIPSFCDVGIEQ